MRNQIKLFSISALLMVMLSGCVTTGEFNFVERSIRKQISPSKVRTNFKFSFGPVSLSTIRAVVRLSDADEEALKYLTEIDKVQVGVYEIDRIDHNTRMIIPQDVEDKLTDSGYELFVRVREKDENVNLYFKQISEKVCSLYCIVLEEDEMVLVEVKGRLDNLIQEALRERGVPDKDILKNS